MAQVEGKTVKVGELYGAGFGLREQEWVPRGLHWWANNNHRAGQGLLAGRLTDLPFGAIIHTYTNKHRSEL